MKVKNVFSFPFLSANGSRISRISPVVLGVLAGWAFWTIQPSFAEEPLPANPSPSPVSAPSPLNATPGGQIMAMQSAAMQSAAQGQEVPFSGNIPKSTSLSANFAWADTFNASALNGGYGGGVTVTRWITANSGLNMNVEIRGNTTVDNEAVNTLIPMMIRETTNIRASSVLGIISPYPTVDIVTTEK